MPPRIRLTFAALSLISFVLAAVALYEELSLRSDIWWTPHAMLVPLGKSSDRVEIYARGKPFAAAVPTLVVNWKPHPGRYTFCWMSLHLM